MKRFFEIKGHHGFTILINAEDISSVTAGEENRAITMRGGQIIATKETYEEIMQKISNCLE
jgi:uncharacterized protein YlzI (FlbEa/FlbD family)